MYAIRVDQSGRRLGIHCSERLTTEEALRIIRHAGILCDAGKLNTITCDVRDVSRGPGGMLRIAVAIANDLRPGQRIGVLADAAQLAIVRRIVRFSGHSRAIRAFTDPGTMETWLLDSRDAYDLTRSPNGRHLELMTAAASAPAVAETRAGGRVAG